MYVYMLDIITMSEESSSAHPRLPLYPLYVYFADSVAI